MAPHQRCKYICKWTKPQLDKHTVILKSEKRHMKVSHNNIDTLPNLLKDFPFNIFWLFARAIEYKKYLPSDEARVNQFRITDAISSSFRLIADDLSFPYFKVSLSEPNLEEFVDRINQRFIPITDYGKLWWGSSRGSKYNTNALFCLDEEENLI